MKTGFLKLAIVIVIGGSLMGSCKTSASVAEMKLSPTPQEQMVTPKGTAVKVAVEIPQIPDKKPTYGEDSTQCVINYALYRQSFGDWENTGDEFFFEDLLMYWNYVFEHCPGYRVNTFINGVKIMEHKIGKFTGEARKGAIDTLMMVYDERMLYFGEEEFVLGEKATAMVKFCPEKTEEIYKLLTKVVQKNKLTTANHLAVYYLQYAVFMYEAGKLSLEQLIDAYLEVDEIAHHNVSLNTPESENYKEGISRIEQLMLNYLECDVIDNVFRPKYMADSTNIELCRKIMGLMAYKKCYDQPLFRSALNQLNRVEPTPRLLMIQGNFFFNDGNYSDAIKSYNEAVKSFRDQDVNEKFEAYMKIGEIQLLQKQYTAAKASVLKALELRSEHPEAILLLADIYLYGAGTCGNSFSAKYAGVWAAFDKYQRARSLSEDPIIQSKANNGISNARRGFPLTSEIFFNNLKVGQSLTAPCWIGETVVVRASDS